MHTNTPVDTGSVPRRSLVASWRAFNTTFDSVFYDVTALSSQERGEMSSHIAPEGAVLIVHPEKRGIESRCPVNFVREQVSGTDPAIDAIVCAGVGSSALGTAALARNVANHLGRPVAGVVSGVGVADVMSEALGGWFVLGAANAMRDVVARVFDAFELKDHVRDQASHDDMKRVFEPLGIKDRFIYGSPDSTTLLYLLSELGDRIKLLVGHSKGNYSIENALRGWIEAWSKKGKPIPGDLSIVTLSAVIRFPPVFSNLTQFIGQVDFFGMANSRPFLERVIVPRAWHTLNAKVPGHVTVRDALREANVPQAAG